MGSFAGVEGSSGMQVQSFVPFRSTGISPPSFPGWSTMVAFFAIARGAALMAFCSFISRPRPERCRLAVTKVVPCLRAEAPSWRVRKHRDLEQLRSGARTPNRGNPELKEEHMQPTYRRYVGSFLLGAALIAPA